MITLAQALSSGSGIERKFSCPVHRDVNPSASVNILKGKWYCYTCHARGTADGAVFEDMDDDTFMSALNHLVGETEREFHPEGWLDQFDAGLPCEYWCSRFEPETVAHFRLGYDAVKDAATYALRDPAGRCIGVVRRSLAGGTKYRYPRHVKTNDLLFNYEPTNVDMVILTEGATDAMAAWEAGFTQESGYLALATFSNRISASQTALLARLGLSRVVVAYDDDEAGNAGAQQVARLLGRDYDLLRPVFPRHAKDLADLSISARRRAVEQAIAL